MGIESLHENQQRIVKALQSAASKLEVTEHFTIVGSLARFLAGQTQAVGDVDVLIDRYLCERYWEFVEELGKYGIVSVYDVLDRPSFHWRPCEQNIAHALSLRIDCQEGKNANLDICLIASDINVIPMSSRWIYMPLPPTYLVTLDERVKGQRIREGNQALIMERERDEIPLLPKEYHPDLQLYYALRRPGPLS